MNINISEKLKERFCKDCNLPINLFKEPYFTERLKLYDSVYHCLEKWKIFQSELKKYPSEQDYLKEYNRVKDTAILCIKNSEDFMRFNAEDMNHFAIKHTGISNKDIYKPTNDGKIFVSIDMKKANFSALSHYSKDIFQNAFTWEEFISKFTDNQHIIQSKYIRQVIMGNCNPGRQVTYEKYLMDKVMYIVERHIQPDRIVFFSNDEIVCDLTGLSLDIYSSMVHNLQCEIEHNFDIPFRTEIFTLHQVPNTSGYIKNISYPQEKIEFKCFTNYELPFVLRAYNHEEVRESDKTFLFDGRLAHFDEIPEIDLSFLQEKEITEDKELL